MSSGRPIGGVGLSRDQNAGPVARGGVAIDPDIDLSRDQHRLRNFERATAG